MFVQNDEDWRLCSPKRNSLDFEEPEFCINLKKQLDYVFYNTSSINVNKERVRKSMLQYLLMLTVQ